MAMTTVNAKIYIARVLGAAQNPAMIDQAGEALLRGYADWEIARRWDFLLKDTSLATTVTGCTITGSSAVVNAPTSGAFDFVNVGQSVTGAGIAAASTISSYTRNSDGTVASITLSSANNNVGSNITLTFGANIVITAGTNDYNLPNDILECYTARFIGNSKHPLFFRRHRHWDYTQYDQTVQGIPSEYTQYNPYSDATQNHGTPHFKFDCVPNSSDTLFLRYYRQFITDGTYVDLPDGFLYTFLDHCRGRALESKRAQENPTAYAKEMREGTDAAGESEEEVEDDQDNFMKSQNEAFIDSYSRRFPNGSWPTE